MAWDDGGYKDVAARIADFKALHPGGCLRPVNPDRPYWFENMDGQTFLVYAAAAYRTPDDPCPGIGVAWEPFPGRTNFTRLSELQNAETSAWGRAIVAVLASESKAVASAEDVRNRQADHAEPDRALPRLMDGWADLDEQRATLAALNARIKALPDDAKAAVKAYRAAEKVPWPMALDEYQGLAGKVAELEPTLEGQEPF